jgi:stalled ribosome alternative rescue factor ArfA
MSDAKPVTVKATVMWCNHNKLNEMSNKYQLELTNLSDNAVKALEGIGLEVRKREDKPEKGFYITCKSVRQMDKIFDKTGASLIDVAIGNGSTGTAIVGTYDWSFKNKKGLSASLIKMTIDNLVAYDAEDTPVTEEAL